MFIKGIIMAILQISEDYVITIILDNHSVHSSRETMEYLGRKPHRFRFVFTPTHASWLNIIETFFNKITRTMLRGNKRRFKKLIEKKESKLHRRDKQRTCRLHMEIYTV